MAKRRVLVTGATGQLSLQLLPVLRERYDLTLIDVKAEDRDGNVVDGVEVVDAMGVDDDTLRPYFEGIDTVLALAVKRVPSDDLETLYRDERYNVDMMHRTYRLATETGVRRVVSASTNQATKWYERPWHDGLCDRVGPEDYPKPERYYGWAKVAYESLGFLFACGNLGVTLENVQLRIVVPREVRLSDFVGRHRRDYLRDIAGWISDRDLQQLFVKSIETPDITDEYGVPFQIFYGVSANTRTFWSISNARRVIGYAPEDDSEVTFADEIAKVTHRDVEEITEELLA